MLGTFGSLKASLPLGKKVCRIELKKTVKLKSKPFYIPFLKFQLTEPHTEGFVNRLHYRASVLLLFGCSLIVTCLEWVGNGNKINCVLTGPVGLYFLIGLMPKLPKVVKLLNPLDDPTKETLVLNLKLEPFAILISIDIVVSVKKLKQISLLKQQCQLKIRWQTAQTYV